MTGKQKAALDFIRAYVAEHDGVSPSLREIASGLENGSLGNVHRLVACLIERGYLRHEGGRKRALVLADSSEFERGRKVGYRQGFRAALRESPPAREVVNA